MKVDSSTLFVTVTSTAYPFTVTTTGCPTQATVTRREMAYERCVAAENLVPRGMAKRDTIIAGGSKPAYASSCAKLGDVSRPPTLLVNLNSVWCGGI